MTSSPMDKKGQQYAERHSLERQPLGNKQYRACLE